MNRWRRMCFRSSSVSQILEIPVEWIFVTGRRISICEGDMNASIYSRYHEEFFTICIFWNTPIDVDYSPFNTARWFLLFKRRSRKKKTLNQYFRNLTRFYLLKLKQHPSSRNVIFQTKGKIIFLSTIYLSLNTKLSKTNFRRMQRRTRSLLHDLRQTKRSKHRSISFFERIRTMSLEGNRRAFPIPPRRLQDSDLTVVTCSISAIVRRS